MGGEVLSGEGCHMVAEAANRLRALGESQWGWPKRSEQCSECGDLWECLQGFQLARLQEGTLA